MEEKDILAHQKDAKLGRMLMTMAVTMLPVLTYGCVSAFLTIALPKLLTSNPTGIVLDVYQVSWICRFSQILKCPEVFSPRQ